MQEANSKVLLGMDLVELSALVEDFKEPSYRSRQLFESIYRQRVDSIEEISTLPSGLRRELVARGISLGWSRTVNKFHSADGTVRYLLACADGETVEAVWMPEGDGGETADGSEAGDASAIPRQAGNRATICVSSQVGCAVDCKFCLTALLGVKRNLSAGEIVGQVCAVLTDQNVSPPQERVNLVFMGMGEPFLNYDNFIK